MLLIQMLLIINASNNNIIDENFLIKDIIIKKYC